MLNRSTLVALCITRFYTQHKNNKTSHNHPNNNDYTKVYCVLISTQ